MKPLTLILPALCALLIANESANAAAGYVTNFDEYTQRMSLSGQTGGTTIPWDTNNFSDNGTPDIFIDDMGQSDYCGVVSGYSVTTTDYWGLIGGATGIAPVTATSYLFRPLDPTGAVAADFSVRFGIIRSQVPRLARDTFGWTFRNAAGLQLLRVSFVPHPALTDKLTVRIYDAQNAEVAGSGTQNISTDAKYELHIALSSANALTVTIGDSLGSTPVRIVNNLPIANPGGPGPIASAISDVAATWTLADPLALAGIYPNFGYNSMVFNNYAVFLSAAPLPVTYSSWATQEFAGSPGADSTLAGDPDRDEVQNRWEYCFRRNPLVGSGSPVAITPAANGETRFEFLWNPHATDVSYQLVGSTDAASPSSWPTLTFDIVSQVLEGDAWRIKLRPRNITGSRYFFSLRINQIPP